MSQSINFDPIRLPPEAEELRLEVREFLADEIANGSFNPSSSILKSGFDREFSKRVGPKKNVVLLESETNTVLQVFKMAKFARFILAIDVKLETAVSRATERRF